MTPEESKAKLMADVILRGTQRMPDDVANLWDVLAEFQRVCKAMESPWFDRASRAAAFVNHIRSVDEL